MTSLDSQKGVTLFSNIEYGNFCEFSPRGKNEKSIFSQKLVARVKAGKRETTDKIIQAYLLKCNNELSDLLKPDHTLVPIPRSSPIIDGASWPSEIIAKELVKNGLGKEVVPLIERKIAIRKSHANYNSSTRPSVEEHLQTLAINPEIGRAHV